MPSTNSSDDNPSAAPDSNTGNSQQTPGPLEPFQLTASQRLAADESNELPSPGRLDQLVNPTRRQRHSSSAPLPPASSAVSFAAAAIGLENVPSSNDEPQATHAQIAAAYEDMDAVIKDAMKAQAAEGDDNPPVPHLQIAADFENVERTIKDSAQHNNQDDAPPLHPSQIDAGLAEETSDEEKGAMKRVAAVSISTEGNVNPSPTPAATSTTPREQDEVVPPTIPPTTRASPPNRPQSSLNDRSGRGQLGAGHPPQSTPPTLPEDDVPDAAVAALQREPSVPMLQATLVRDQEVYDGVPVAENAEKTFCEKYRKFIIGSLVVLLIVAVLAQVVTLNSTETPNDSERSNEPEEILSSTTNPSESLRPSQIPLLRPSLSASQVTSFRPSLGPSSMPSPTLYCGEVNIVTDIFPWEISWSLSSALTATDGTWIPTKVVLEGSPKEEDHHHVDDVCLERGNYEFAIFDSCGDGIFSPGYYNVTFDGVVVAQGGKFGSEDRVLFTLPIRSLSPSESASPSRTPSLSFRPSESASPSKSLMPSLRPSTSFSPSTFWSSLDWNRQGQGISGDAIDDWFGNDIAFSEDALTMAIGAPGYFGNSDRPGYVKVFHREGEGLSWEQRGNTLSGEAHGDGFGKSLSLSDDGMTLSVGAPLNDFNGSNAGQVKVYRWDKGVQNYEQLGETLYGEESRDRFGWSLDLSSNGKILAVGADQSNANGAQPGSVHVYAWDHDNATYKQWGQIINGDAAHDHFGQSVSLAGDGSKLAVGANGNDSNGEDSGQVKVFAWNEATSNYMQLGDSLLGDAAVDLFGFSVSFSRDGLTLAVGAIGVNANGSESGQVQVFKWDEATLNHKQVGKSLYGTGAYDLFGWSVALSSNGETLAIGANQINTDKPGYVQVFGWDGAASEYNQMGKTLVGEASNDGFGVGQALSANGKNLAVGAANNDRNGADSGLVEVFDNEF